MPRTWRFTYVGPQAVKILVSEQRENARFVQSRNVLFHGAEEARWERSGWR